MIQCHLVLEGVWCPMTDRHFGFLLEVTQNGEALCHWSTYGSGSWLLVMSHYSTKWVILHFMLCLLFQALLPLWSIFRLAVDSYVTCWVQETNSSISLLVLQNTQRLKEDACLPVRSLLGHDLQNISCLLSPVSLPYVLCVKGITSGSLSHLLP